MRIDRRRGSLAAVAVALLCLTLTRSARADGRVLISTGTFTDASGGKHPWKIDGDRTLVWDSQPFLPVGGVFQARSWAAEPTQADFDSDVAALKILKDKGVTDLFVQPARGGLTGVKAQNVQRLIDLLERDGFTYGISINDGPRDPLIGFIVKPGAYRLGDVPAGPARIAAPNLLSALYVVAESATNVLEHGQATLTANGARFGVGSHASPVAAFLVPEKIFAPGNGTGLPNLWDGFDDYRDALLALFAQVKLGKGFRFFVDSLEPSPALGLSGEAERLIPSGTGFRTEWAAWLAKKYKQVDRLQSVWGIPERDLTEIARAADLIPLWSGGKGVSRFYDKATGKLITAVPEQSAFWDDLDAFKTESVRAYMNDVATVLKRQVADVPVVYRSSGYSPVFSRIAAAPTGTGFDGIGIDAYGRGRDLVARSGGYAYAQSAEAARTIWLPVIGTSDAAATAPKPEAGYPSRATLFSDLDWLREIGARGFYVNGLRLADPARKNFSLVETPDQLTWLRDYKGMLAAITNPAPPRVVFYPRSLTVASLRPLSSGGWWLPTDRAAVAYDFGAAGRVYGLPDESGTVWYVWNPKGVRELRLRAPKYPKDVVPPPIQVIGAPPLKEKKDILTIQIGPEPIAIRGLPTAPIPLDAFPEMLAEAETLVGLAKKRGLLSAGLYQERVALAKAQFRPDDPLPGIGRVQETLAQLRNLVRPYAWIEAEGPVGSSIVHSFDEATTRAGASGGRVLVVGDRSATGNSPALVTYQLDAATDGVYSVWVAATPGAPLSFRLDGEPVANESAEARGASYADGLVWTRLGSVPVTKGRHALELRANGPAVVDVLLFTPDNFSPDGANPPPILP